MRILGKFFTKYQFGNRIMTRRKKCGFKSQVALAAEMVSQNNNADDCEKQVESKRKAISNWESGKAEPSLTDFVLLCDLLDCDAKYLLGEIDVPRAEEKTVMDITGLSCKAVEKLILINQTNKITWWGDSLNSIIESDNFLDLLHTITDYIDDQGDDAQIINSNIAANSTKAVKCSDILQYKVQNLLFSILRKTKSNFENREDYRIFYSLIYNHEKSGNLSHDQALRCIEKLDRGDLSDFAEGENRNG